MMDILLRTFRRFRNHFFCGKHIEVFPILSIPHNENSPRKLTQPPPVAIGAARVSGGSCSKSDYIKQRFSKLFPRVRLFLLVC